MLDHDVAEGRAQAGAGFGRAVACVGEEFGGLAGEAEGAGHEPRADVLAGPAGDGELEVVDRRRTVQGQAVEDPPADPVDQVRAAARLDHMPAHRGDDRAPVRVGPDDRVAEPLQAPGGEEVGQAIEPIAHRDPGGRRAAEIGQADLARAVGEGLVSEVFEVKAGGGEIGRGHGESFPGESSDRSESSRGSAPSISSRPILRARSGTGPIAGARNFTESFWVVKPSSAPRDRDHPARSTTSPPL